MTCLHGLPFPPQLVHGVIDGVCGKQGARYEVFAKTLTLADFSRLVRCVESLVKIVGREGGSKQQVREGREWVCLLHCHKALCTVCLSQILGV